MTRNGTPVEGVPIPDHGAQYGADAVPKPVERVDTGPLSTRMLAAVADVGAMPVEGVPSPEEFLDALAAKLAQKTGGGDGPPPKKFLGLGKADWIKLLIGWAVVVLVFLGTWYLSVRDGLRERPTTEQVMEVVKQGVNGHAEKTHPTTQIQIDQIKTEQRTIRDSQIRQEQIDISQSETLDEIKEDVKLIRRRQ